MLLFAQIFGVFAMIAFVGVGMYITGKDFVEDERDQRFEEYVEEAVEMLKK